MINIDDELIKKNLDLLWDGYWYTELPPILDMNLVKNNLNEVINQINEEYSDDFNISDRGIIDLFKSITSPNYIFKDGIEPIIFFEFKNNGALREMQIPNLKYYIAFVYNTMVMYNKLFIPLYSNDMMNEYVKHSNSYLLFKDLFYVNRSYDGSIEEIEGCKFAVRNNKVSNQLTYKENIIRFLERQGSKLYTVKIDVESFFPNVYTHYLSRIKNEKPFSEMSEVDYYFDFLDYYNMKTNNNQTKGIAAGVFSSTISAELLMLCVDNEIKQVIGDNIEYVRYVDDMTFFCDSLEEISSKLPLIQYVLNKYRLRINNNKTEIKLSVENKPYVDIQMMKDRFDYLNIDEDPHIVTKDIFYNIKSYLSKAKDSEKRSEIKAFLTMLKSAISDEKLIFDIGELVRYEKYISDLMMQLAQVDSTLASRCYRVIEAILKKTKERGVYNSILNELKSKNKWINNKYHDSMVQIWHYYLLAIYDDKYRFKDFREDLNDYEINPIIVAAFVLDGKNNNKELYKYIKKMYMESIGEDDKSNKWKESIMYSKWWFPLCMIYQKDKHNYDSFFESKNFNKMYKIIFHR